MALINPCGYYDVTDEPATLIRMGITEPCGTNRAGVRYALGMVRRDGRVRVFVKAARAIEGDARFRRALDMVLEGAPLPAFSPGGGPRRTRRR